MKDHKLYDANGKPLAAPTKLTPGLVVYVKRSGKLVASRVLTTSPLRLASDHHVQKTP